jgi:hypothetical protein
MAGYQYDVITWTNKDESQLKDLCNQKGTEGWELFQVLTPSNKTWTCVFRKRT